MEKVVWYHANGICEGGGPGGALVVTRDELNGSIDSAKIMHVFREVPHL